MKILILLLLITSLTAIGAIARADSAPLAPPVTAGDSAAGSETSGDTGMSAATVDDSAALSRTSEPPASGPRSFDTPALPRMQAEWSTSDFLDPAFAGADSLPVEQAQPRSTAHLLPENMSFMERGLWGESGFFRWTGIAGPLGPEERKGELSARRTMLTMHQIGGFVTLGLLGATLYYGQRYLNYSDRTDRDRHLQFVTYAIISYSLTGLLAVLSPPPLIRRSETSTTTIHKTLAWIHAAGMILTPIVGGMIRKRSGRFSYDDLATAHFHQVSAYVTTGVFAASLIVITF